MSKSISFGFGKPKSAPQSASAAKPSFSIKPSTTKKLGRPTSALAAADSDDSEDENPRSEAVAGFSSTGAILTKPKKEKDELVIANQGNADWRKRGKKNLLPAGVQAQQSGTSERGGGVVTVERDEASKSYGLQFADKSAAGAEQNGKDEGVEMNGTKPQEKQLTEDERAIQALMSDETGPKSTATIDLQGNVSWQQRDETEDFQADVASRPDSSTLEEYAAMPVEEFGMAMLRGMGKKRRANGEIIRLDRDDKEKDTKKARKQEGFLGIGAKPVKGLEGVELGAWGKAEMRKNQRGEGFFTPVMMEDKRTGERITEEEFERRKRDASGSNKQGEEDWKSRRDRNLDKHGRERQENGHKESRNGSSRDRTREKENRDHDSSESRSRRDRDTEDYDSSRSRRDRSRSKERSRRDDRSEHSSRRDDKQRERDRDYRRDDKYDSSSSRRNGHKYKDRDRDRDRDERRHGSRR